MPVPRSYSHEKPEIPSFRRYNRPFRIRRNEKIYIGARKNPHHSKFKIAAFVTASAFGEIPAAKCPFVVVASTTAWRVYRGKVH